MWDSREVRSVSFGLVLGVREAYNRAFALGVVSFSFCFPWGFLSICSTHTRRSPTLFFVYSFYPVPHVMVMIPLSVSSISIRHPFL